MESLLTDMGLSEKAAQLYLASLQLGPGSLTELARRAAMKRPTAYLVVDELLMKGFLRRSRKGRRSLFEAEPPRRLLQIAQSHVRDVERHLPELEALFYEPKEKPRIKIYEGKNGMLAMYDEMFGLMRESEDEMLFFTAIGDLEEHFPAALDRFYALLKEAKPDYRIRELNIGDARGHAYAKRLRGIAGKNHRIRLLDPKVHLFTNTDTMIFRNTVNITSFHRELFTVSIESPFIAQTLRTIFEAAWTAGKPAL
jgi:sugar-specific transcriptional regulator TrmB